MRLTIAALALSVALSSKGVVGVADIGPTKRVDALVAEACRAIISPAGGDINPSSQCFEQSQSTTSPPRELQTIGRELYDTLLGRFAQNIETAKLVIISPDGELGSRWQIPDPHAPRQLRAERARDITMAAQFAESWTAGDYWRS